MTTTTDTDHAEAVHGEATSTDRAGSRPVADRRLRLAVYGILLLGVLVALGEARAIFLPLAMAFLLSFLFRPAVRRAAAIGLAPPLTAALVVATLGTCLALAGYALKEPATEWVREAPYSLKELQYRIAEWREPIAEVQAASDALDDLRAGDQAGESQVIVKDQALEERILVGASSAALSVFTTLVMLFFILGWGQRFFRNLVGVMPRFSQRRDAVTLFRDVERSIARYLTTITFINIALGIVVAGVMYLLNMPNAALWGAVAGLLNYVPYVGPAITAVILAFAAALSFPSLGQAMLVPASFLLITAIEGNFITPSAVGSQLTLNPLLIFLTLILWFWMWGFIGALLTVPILVCVKAALAYADGGGFRLARLLD